MGWLRFWARTTPPDQPDPVEEVWVDLGALTVTVIDDPSDPEPGVVVPEMMRKCIEQCVEAASRRGESTVTVDLTKLRSVSRVFCPQVMARIALSAEDAARTTEGRVKVRVDAEAGAHSMFEMLLGNCRELTFAWGDQPSGNR
jgi:hypothetical protein